MIGLACGELARYSDVLPGIIGLQKPQGTVFMKASVLGPANGFNGIAREFLSHKHLEWLFLTNDDNICPQDSIPRLLDREVDVVSGLYFARQAPFEPIAFDRWTWEARTGGTKLTRWWHRHLMKRGETGLLKVAAVGDGCLLIRRHVLETLLDPWWEYGETFTDVCDHDVRFSRKVVEAGFELYCDLDIVVDHIATFNVRPVRLANGEWKVRLVQGQKEVIELPAAAVQEEKNETVLR